MVPLHGPLKDITSPVQPNTVPDHKDMELATHVVCRIGAPPLSEAPKWAFLTLGEPLPE